MTPSVKVGMNHMGDQDISWGTRRYREDLIHHQDSQTLGGSILQTDESSAWRILLITGACTFRSHHEHMAVVAPVPNRAPLSGNEEIGMRDAAHNRATADWTIRWGSRGRAVLHVALTSGRIVTRTTLN
jgi:hypothetical protein